MPSQYNGQPANILLSTTPSLTVIGATNASPVVVQTGAAHGLTTGDYVNTSNVWGNEGANGTWPIVVVDSTHFSETGSTGTGSYTSHGSVQPLRVPTFQIPSDGDSRNAASINVGLEALGDRTAALGVMTGQYKLHSESTQVYSDLFLVGGVTWATATVAATGIANIYKFIGSYTPWSQGMLDLLSTDIVDVQLDATSAASGVTSCVLMLGYINQAPASLFSGTPTPLPGSAKLFTSPGGPITLRGRVTGLAHAATAVYPMVYSNAGTGTVTLLGDFTMTIRVWRATGMPQ
jgi:hypothetical protein